MADVSIIIPCFNCANYLESCLESVLKQSFKDIEIICIDDGSTDDTPDIIKKFSLLDSRIKIISQKNMGCLQARCKGVENSTGKYISFIDSDDIVEIDFIEKLREGFCSNDVDIVVSGYRNEDEYGKLIYEISPTRKILPSGRVVVDLLCSDSIKSGLFSMINKMYRRHVIDLSIFKTRLINYGEDRYLNLRIFSNSDGLVSFVDNVSYKYIRHPGSLITKFGLNHVSDFLILQEELDKNANLALEKNQISDFYRLRNKQVFDFYGDCYRSDRKIAADLKKKIGRMGILKIKPIIFDIKMIFRLFIYLTRN